MSKALMQKVIEAGIVPVHAVKQMKAWRQLSDDVPEIEQRQVTQQQLLDFVQDIENLLDAGGELPELRETIPGIEAAFKSKRQPCVVIVSVGRQTVSISSEALVEGAKQGSPSCLIFRADIEGGERVARVGNQVWLGGVDVFEVTETTPLYRGETVSFYRCKVQGVPEHAQMSELRQIRQ